MTDQRTNVTRMIRPMHAPARAIVSSITLAAALAAAALLAAGCGTDASTGSSTSSNTPPKQTNERPAITAPTADADLTKELGDAGDALTKAGCVFGTFTEEEAEHVDEGTDLASKTFPPTSGHHYENWAPFGQYEDGIADGFAIHNLEHGGVVTWLGTEVDDATTDAISGLLDDGEKWLVAPRADIDGLYSAAWATGLSCPPAALAKLGPSGTADALDRWFDVVVSTGSAAEKDLPAYAGAMKEPVPTHDISEESPF